MTQSFIIPPQGQIDRRRKLADVMAEQGMSAEPVQSWTQGAARLAQSLAGAYGNYQANQMEGQRNSSLAKALQGDVNPDQLAQLAAQSGDLNIMDIIKFKQAAAAAKQNSYGKQFYTIRDAQGHLRYVQPGPEGGAADVSLPEGFSPSENVTQVNQGTQYQGIGSRSAVPQGAPTPINNEAKAQATSIGTHLGENQATLQNQLPQAEIQLKATNALIDSIVSDPALEYSVGQGVHRLRQFAHPQASIDFYNKLDSLNGQALLAQLPALNAMKPISNIEGETATKAALAIDQYKRTSPERTIEALRTFQALINDRMGAMRSQAGGAAPGDWHDMGNGVRIQQIGP